MKWIGFCRITIQSIAIRERKKGKQQSVETLAAGKRLGLLVVVVDYVIRLDLLYTHERAHISNQSQKHHRFRVVAIAQSPNIKFEMEFTCIVLRICSSKSQQLRRR